MSSPVAAAVMAAAALLSVSAATLPLAVSLWSVSLCLLLVELVGMVVCVRRWWRRVVVESQRHLRPVDYQQLRPRGKAKGRRRGD